MVRMATYGHIDAPEPDLAQLLVLEAGRMLEDLTPELALRLPNSREDRHDMITSMIVRLDRAHCLLTAASKI